MMSPYERRRRSLGECPIEAGFMHELADHECRHGFMPTRRHPWPDCGCFPRVGPYELPARPPVLRMPVAPPKPRPVFTRRSSVRSVLARMARELMA